MSHGKNTSKLSSYEQVTLGVKVRGRLIFLYISVSDLLQQRVDNLPSPPKKSQGCWVKENGNWVPLSSEELMRVATDHKAPLVQGAGSRGGSWRTGVRVAARGATCLLAYGHLWWGGAVGDRGLCCSSLGAGRGSSGWELLPVVTSLFLSQLSLL